MINTDIKKVILKNGLKLITIYNDSSIFSMEAGVKVGSLYENKDNNGISHLIEHMLFKGTSNRDRDTLNSDIEKLAGDFDIYTTYQETLLTAEVLKDMADKCLEIVSDMFMNASFPKSEFNLEKKVIIEEIKMTKDDLEERCYLGLYKSAFPDTWYRYLIAGTIKSVRALKLEDVKKFYRSYYVPDNVVLCIASPFSHDKVRTLVEKYFSSWKRGQVVPPAEREYCTAPGKIIRYRKNIEQAHILYGFDIHNLNRREKAVLSVINKKLGAGANSVLFRELRDKKGYAYNVYSDMDLNGMIGMFYIYAAVSKENLKGAVSVIDHTINRFGDTEFPIDGEGIKLIKDIFVTNTSIAMESPSDMVEYVMDGEMEYDNPLEYENMLSIMNTIGVEDIRVTANKILQNPVVYILCPRA